MTDDKKIVGVIGGSGFYSLLEDVEKVRVDTPYGPPSDRVSHGKIGDTHVAFIPRHSSDHSIPPHKVPYAANIYALHSIGVKQIVTVNAVGSLQKHVKPGDIVFTDQFVDRTKGRKDTFYDGPIVTHVSTAEPYCEKLREIAIDCAAKHDISCHEKGCVVIINGPRFSTKAESRWFSSMGWEIVGMTQYPECVLAMEKEMCMLNIAVVTDYDSGVFLDGDAEPVQADEVMRVFQSNIQKVKDLVCDVVVKIPGDRDCHCSRALEYARM